MKPVIFRQDCLAKNIEDSFQMFNDGLISYGECLSKIESFVYLEIEDYKTDCKKELERIKYDIDLL